ncbi:MAG: bifunctional DedA family/phosphatase PAP2 family protein [Fibrobacteria bacterium]
MTFLDRILNISPELLNPLAYWIILLISFLEPIPVLGAFLPGQILLILGGVLVKRGVLDFGDAVAFATAGAVLGDFVNYFVGARYGDGFLAKYGKHFFLKADRLDHIRTLLHEHTGKTLILGRFSSVTRCAAPFLAGSSGIPFLKFLCYNLAGGFGWSLGLVSVGWFFGEGYEIAARHLGRFLLSGFLLSAFIILLVKWKNKGNPVFHPDHRYVLIANVLFLFLFARLLDAVTRGDWIAAWDIRISDRIDMLRTPFMDGLMKAVSVALRPLHLGIATLAVGAGVLLKRRWQLAWFLAIGLGGGMLLDYGIKILIHRPGPGGGQTPVLDFSFPATHATAAVLCSFLAIFMFKEIIATPWLRRVFSIANGMLVALTGFSVVWLDAHWSSDVVGGVALGIFWLTLLLLCFRNFIPGFRGLKAFAPESPRKAQVT